MTGPLELFVIGSKSTPRELTYKVLFASPELERELPFDKSPRLRIEGEIEDIPVKVAWQPSGRRGHYVMVSPAVIKALRLNPGDEVSLRFNLASEDAVDVPDELRDAVAKNAKRRKLWAALTPGRQRGLAYLVSSAKTAPTRLKRAALVVEKLETNRLDDLGPPKRRGPDRSCRVGSAVQAPSHGAVRQTQTTLRTGGSRSVDAARAVGSGR